MRCNAGERVRSLPLARRIAPSLCPTRDLHPPRPPTDVVWRPIRSGERGGRQGWGGGGAPTAGGGPPASPRAKNTPSRRCPSFCVALSLTPPSVTPSTHRMRMFMASFLEPRRCGGGKGKEGEGGRSAHGPTECAQTPRITPPPAARRAPPTPSPPHRNASRVTHVIVLGRARRHDVVRRHRRGVRLCVCLGRAGARACVCRRSRRPGRRVLWWGAGARERRASAGWGTEARGAACVRTSPVQ